jgi:hypothetical protein
MTQRPQHCDHECVCWWYYNHQKSGSASPCQSDKCYHFRQYNQQSERKKIIKKIYGELEKCHYLIWQSPQSFGQRDVVDWEDIEDIFEEFKKSGEP